MTDGARTRDLRGHIPALCQLSYGHQGASSVAQTDGGPGRARTSPWLAPVAQLDRAVVVAMRFSGLNSPQSTSGRPAA